jgi:hypothetical protein
LATISYCDLKRGISGSNLLPLWTCIAIPEVKLPCFEPVLVPSAPAQCPEPPVNSTVFQVVSDELL